MKTTWTVADILRRLRTWALLSLCWFGRMSTLYSGGRSSSSYGGGKKPSTWQSGEGCAMVGFLIYRLGGTCGSLFGRFGDYGLEDWKRNITCPHGNVPETSILYLRNLSTAAQWRIQGAQAGFEAMVSLSSYRPCWNMLRSPTPMQGS